MNKTLQTIISLLLAFSLAFVAPINTTYAAEAVADFEIDPELWRCMVETNTFDYDENKDGVITKEEFASSYGMQIDAEGYDIKDWSALKYAADWQMISIRNCPGGDFSALSELTKLYRLNLSEVSDCSSLVGLEKIPNLSSLSINSTNEIDLKVFTDSPKLVTLSLSAPSFSGYEALSEYDKLSSLGLFGDTIEGIENIPELSDLYRLSLSFPDLDDLAFSGVTSKMKGLKEIVINESKITNMDWLKNLDISEYDVYYIDVTDNQISDISALLDVIDIMDDRTSLFLGNNPIDKESHIKLIEKYLSITNNDFMYTGANKRILAYAQPTIDFVDEENIKAESADNEIVEVAHGQIIAKKAGTTTLKFTYDDIEFEYTLTVMDKEETSTVVTEGFTIEDSELLKALAQYDADDNGVLTMEEMSTVKSLVLDNYPIKSLKGLEVFDIYSISANNCEIESLDGIRNMENLATLKLDGNNLTELGDISGLWGLDCIHLRNNKLNNVEDFANVIESGAHEIKIEGNPFYEDVKAFLFYDYYRPLTIISAEGTTVHQKLEYGTQEVDLDYAEWNNGGFMGISLLDVTLPGLEFEIEDTSIATIGEKTQIIREWYFTSAQASSDVLEINLLREGKTRMKITCGDFVRYTDIIVLPSSSVSELRLELDSISDTNFVDALNSLEKTFSGIVSRDTLTGLPELTVDAEKSPVIAFESLAELNGLKKFGLINYSQEMFDSITGLNENVNFTDFSLENGQIKNLKFNDKIPTVERFVAVGNEIETIDVAETFENLKYVDLKNNNIANYSDITLPDGVSELYLEGNPLTEDALSDIFDKYMFSYDIKGAVDSYVAYSNKVDVIPFTDVKFEVANENIAKRRGDEIKLVGEGITVMKLTYGSTSKVVTVISGEYDRFLMGDVNGSKSINAEDALEILKYSAKLMDSTDFIVSIGDMDSDSDMNAADALEVLKIAAKITE